MQRFDAVPVGLRELLDELLKMDELSTFLLGGGTSLALRYAHRRSIDIDLFSVAPFDSEALLNRFGDAYPGLAVVNRTTGSLCLEIRRTKIDLLHHAFGELAGLEVVDGVRCLSQADVSAMKINAVTNRGSKKDFTDLLQLHVSGLELGTALENYCRKYGPRGKFLAVRSLQFFDDARLEPDPIFLNGWTWLYVEDEMREIVARVIEAEGS